MKVACTVLEGESGGNPADLLRNKLQSLFSWIDYLDFLKTYDTTFDAGTQFSLVQMEVKLSTIPGLKEKPLMESTKYRQVPLTIQNIFLNQSLESRVIKDTIIDSMDFASDDIDW